MNTSRNAVANRFAIVGRFAVRFEKGETISADSSLSYVLHRPMYDDSIWFRLLPHASSLATNLHRRANETSFVSHHRHDGLCGSDASTSGEYLTSPVSNLQKNPKSQSKV